MIRLRRKKYPHQYCYHLFFPLLLLSLSNFCYCATAATAFVPTTTSTTNPGSIKGRVPEEAAKEPTTFTEPLAATTKNTITAPEVVPSTPKPMTPPSFYQRKLPETCVAFASKAGKKIFSSALANNGLKSFFPLIQQFTTQSEPAFCGLSTLVLVLNALAVDPRQNWKGPWRWYEEKMLNCCLDLEDVKKTGITLRDFQCLAFCQGLSVELTHCDEESTLDDFRSAVKKACVDDDDDDDDDDNEGDGDNDNNDNTDEGSDNPSQALVVSYSRKVIGQTGSGHFSPLAAYDAESDSVLILDTARFKYGAHWVKLPLIYEAMKPIDPTTGKSRGYALLSFIPQKKLDGQSTLQPVSIVFRSKMSQHPIRRKYKEYLESLKADGREITWSQVVEHWSEVIGEKPDGNQTPTRIWYVLEPLRLPASEEEKMAVMELRQLIKALRTARKGPMPFCCDSNDHKACLSSPDALYIMYLASVPEGRRMEIISSDVPEETKDITIEQLLREAELIATAIETSDQTSF